MSDETRRRAGPASRWEKNLASSLNGNLNTTMRSLLSVSYNTSLSGGSGGLGISGISGISGVSGKSQKSTAPGGGDRFIPDFKLPHLLALKDSGEGSDGEINIPASARKRQRQKLIADVFQVEGKAKRRILNWNKAPATTATTATPECHTTPKSIKIKSGTRHIPTSSKCILDAPDFINDYNLHLMDWSSDNIVAVALGRCVFLWHAASGKTEKLLELEAGHYVGSLSWVQQGQILAIGHIRGAVELWDCSKMKRLHVMAGHRGPVGSLAWNSFLVSSGSRDGTIIHHDVRLRGPRVSSLDGHSRGVCGLKWSTDFKYLASGGNDNLVNVWSLAGSGVGTPSEPLHTFDEHQAAVRALAWCPWQPSTLASGGGALDRCIKFWDVNQGLLIKSVDAKSQVGSMLFSRHHQELISAHGFANNQLTIWQYPTMQKLADLTGHRARVLHMALSPDGRTVISGAADETLRLWNCFAPDPDSGLSAKQSVFRQTIR